MGRTWLLALLLACSNEPGGGGGGGPMDAPRGADGPGGGGKMDAPANQTPKQFCVSETNRYRAMNSKPALVESAQLEQYADTGAMIDFSSSPHNHFMMTNGGGISFAENECPVQGGWTLPPGGDMKAPAGQCVAAVYAENRKSAG